MALLLASTPEEPLFKKAKKSTDYVVTLVHPDGLDIVEGEAVEVLCVSQNLRSLSDPAVGERVCLIANAEAEGSLKIKGTVFDDYMVMHYNHMLLICFEAFKILDQVFTDILKATGGLKEHRNFIRRFRKSAEKAAASHSVPIPKGMTWVESIPFGVFAEGVLTVYDCQVSSETEKKKIKDLKEYAEHVFRDVLIEGLELLEEESESLQIDFVDFQAIKASPVQDLVNEWVCSARNRAQRNTIGHPFGASTPPALRKASLKSYRKCVEHEITKGFRNVALLGRVKLEIDEKKLNQSPKTKGSSLNASELLTSDDSSDDDSDDDMLNTIARRPSFLSFLRRWSFRQSVPSASAMLPSVARAGHIGKKNAIATGQCKIV